MLFVYNKRASARLNGYGAQYAEETRRIVGKTVCAIDVVYIYNGTMHFCAHERRGVITPFASVRQKRAGFGEEGRRRLDRSATGFYTRGGNSARVPIWDNLSVTSEIYKKTNFHSSHIFFSCFLPLRKVNASEFNI